MPLSDKESSQTLSDFINYKLAKFNQLYPDIELSISYQNSFDLIKDNFDIAISGFMPQSQNQKVRKIYLKIIVQ